ncbi:MAG: hypothetical protein AB7G08_33555 [Hyphomicrobiaceae bacterium]
MTNSNSRNETLHTIGLSVGSSADDLPDDSQALVAQKAAIEAKIETVIVPAIRDRWHREAADIGRTPEQVLGIKKRGRKPKQKSEE